MNGVELFSPEDRDISVLRVCFPSNFWRPVLLFLSISDKKIWVLFLNIYLEKCFMHWRILILPSKLEKIGMFTFWYTLMGKNTQKFFTNKSNVADKCIGICGGIITCIRSRKYMKTSLEHSEWKQPNDKTLSTKSFNSTCVYAWE